MKKILSVALAAMMMLSLAACGSKEETSASAPFTINEEPLSVDSASEEEAKTEEKKEEVIPPNSYRSELTNEWISNDIKNQRPIAVMVDNESTALPHYGTTDADIVYELMNSTLNDRITRLMCIVKDWQDIEMIGNVRSTRPTNCFLFTEYNAILVHDGGPFMINDWLALPNSTNHLSGGFARIDRGKQGFYEEYATGADYKGSGEYAGNTYKGLVSRIQGEGWDMEYNKYDLGPHFQFSDEEFTLDDEPKAKKAELVKLPYLHNQTRLTYDEKKGVYVYSEYGQKYEDAAKEDKPALEFKNVIIQGCSFFEYGDGYMCYNAIGSSQKGYYLTNGKAIPISWEKPTYDVLTKFYKLDTKEEITLNTGKTYITLCPDDVWSDLVIE